MKPGYLVRKLSSEQEWLKINPWEETSEGVIFWRENTPVLVLEVNPGSGKPFEQIKILTRAGIGWIYSSKVEIIRENQ
jgi:hypothetical protein